MTYLEVCSLKANKKHKTMKITKELEERIEEAMMEFRHENLLGAGQLNRDNWTQILQNAGLSDKEIAEYRAEMQKYAAALDDPLDAYRD